MATMYEIVRASNTGGKSSWSSVNEAMGYLTKRHPCEAYRPEVWRIMAVSASLTCALH